MELEAMLGGSVLGQYCLLFAVLSVPNHIPVCTEGLYQTFLLLEIHFSKCILLQVGEKAESAFVPSSPNALRPPEAPAYLGHRKPCSYSCFSFSWLLMSSLTCRI